ncbi:MAG: integration host factor subunit beta [Elusimicrobia bacterium]|nr:integration host factor subunit beta [Elusimicrobiota bacterium]
MNRLDIINAVAKILSSRADATRAVRAVFDAMTQSLNKGEKVVISNFGTFRIKLRRPRQGRNPKTGGSVAVPERRGVRFKASRNLLAS